MQAGGGPPPPPPPPPPGGGGGVGANAAQLPPHLQSMMREVQATLGVHHQQHQYNDQQLPMQFGNSHGRGGGGRGHHHHQNNSGSGRGGRGRGGRGQRGGGRGYGGGRGNGFAGRGGGGRGGFHHHDQRHGQQQQQQHHGQMKRKRDFDGNGAARFFLPSCLEDPWLPLLQPRSAASTVVSTSSAFTTYGAQLPTDSGYQHHHRQQQPPPPRPGRVLFQPSFLDDPWTAFVR